MNTYQLARGIGLITVAFGCLLGIAPFTPFFSTDSEGLLFYGFLQVFLGYFLFYASGLKLRGNPVSHKLFPASVTALVLYSFMLARWLLNT